MGSEDYEEYSEYPEFSDAMRRLGWLSSYSRQIVLSRHMLRSLQDHEVAEQILWSNGDNLALNSFRAAITVLSGANIELKKFSAPYEPTDRPDTHFLAFKRQQRVFDVSIASALPSIAFHNSSGASFGFENSKVGSEEDAILIQEIKMLAEGVSLSTKHIADERAAELRNTKLWGSTGFSDWTATRNFFDEWLLRTPKASDFWRRWVWGFLTGEPIDWNLQREIALISDDDWSEGPEHIAELIAGIETRILSERTNLVEEIVLDAETERFKSIPIPVENVPLIQAVIERINDNLLDALLGRNGLRDDEGFVGKLRRANTRYQNDPQRLELDYTSAARSIRRLVASKELSEAEDNLTLLESVEDGAKALRANHPEVAANREQLAKQNLRQLTEDDLALLADAETLLPLVSADMMSEDFAIDIPQLINDATLPLPSGAPPLPGADETTRIFYRVSRMQQIIDATTDKGASVFDSKGFKTVRLGLTLSSLLGALVSIGLRIVGVI